MHIKLETIFDSDFEEYVEMCKEKGYTILSNSSSTEYSAYNEEGYNVIVSYDKSNWDMEIQLFSPMEMETIQWPKSTIGKKVPVPKTLEGKISFDNEKDFQVYIGNTDKNIYQEYVDMCFEHGFNSKYSKKEGLFQAYDEEGNYLSVIYAWNNVMQIRATSPTEKILEEEIPVKDTAKNNDDAPKDIATATIVKEAQSTLVETNDNSFKEESVKDSSNEDAIMNISNSPELSAILTTKNEFDPLIKQFANKYRGKVIEFDGYTAQVARHKDYKTRFDYLIYVGNYNSSPVVGPQFQIQDVNYYDLHLTGDNIPGTFVAGLNIHIVAEVGTYNENTGLFQIKPIKITMR